MSRARRPNRRRFLTSLASGLALARPLTARAVAGPSSTFATRALGFRHLHTGESLRVEYERGGGLAPEALDAVNHLLRDFRTGDIHPIDPRLLALLQAVADRLGTRRPFEVISGYRSPVTNAALRRRSENVAARSLHMVGQAIDVRLGDVDLPRLRAAALDLGRGGVGYYPASNFVHVDTGRVRRW